VPSPASDAELVAEVVRCGFVESRHRGHVVAVDAAGAVVLSIGNPPRPFFPRSANKPLQLAAMVELGLAAPPEQLAVAAASHAGLPMHVAQVRALLAASGLTEADLDNTPDLPLDPAAARAVLASGGTADRLRQNCSGNHAAMLATCVVRRWPTSGYLDPRHPLQVAIRSAYETLAGTPLDAPAVDGCGAPLYALPLVSLARAYAALVAVDGTPANRTVAAAMRTYPQLVDGPGRIATVLMVAVPGLLAKGGAEGVFAVGLPDGGGLAVKIEDGASRACGPVVVAALRRLGVDADPMVAAALTGLETVSVFGHGEVVGEVRAAASLAMP
jgi:L-asparaginase II